jgi:hypothetical protein
LSRRTVTLRRYLTSLVTVVVVIAVALTATASAPRRFLAVPLSPSRLTGDASRGGDEVNVAESIGIGAALNVATPDRAPDHARTNLATFAGPVTVAKNLIVDATGARVVLAGAADYLMPFYTADNGQPDSALAQSVPVNFDRRDQDFAAMKAAGYNAVRVPVSTDVFSANPYFGGGTAAYLQRMREIATSATNAGLYVIVGWWGLLGGAQSAAALQPALTMMKAVADALRDFPSVLYEPVNEPFNISWPDWHNAMTTIMTWWRTTIGYHGPLIIDTINWSWSFDAGQATQLQTFDAKLLGGTSQLVFANHRYANASSCFCGAEQSSWQSEIGANVATFPILGTEYGWFNHQGAPRPSWNDQLFAYLAQRAVPAGLNGAIAFVWHWVDDNSMTTSASAPNAYAAAYHDNFVAALPLTPLP